MLGEPWRELAVEVTPEVIRVFWEGERIGQVTRASLTASADYLLKTPRNLDRQQVRPAFAPRDALGLYVDRGVALFRSVAIEPLSEDP